MEIHPTPDQEMFIRRAVASGRVDSPDGAVKEALAMWEERERRRVEILAAIDEAEDSLARGEGRTITLESMRALVDEVRQRGRTRLGTEQRAKG